MIFYSVVVRDLVKGYIMYLCYNMKYITFFVIQGTNIVMTNAFKKAITGISRYGRFFFTTLHLLYTYE